MIWMKLYVKFIKINLKFLEKKNFMSNVRLFNGFYQLFRFKK